MTTLASRKKLLIAESELNRAQLVQEWQTLAGEAHALAHRARTIAYLASAAASVVGGLALFRRHQSKPVVERASWLQTILKGGQLAGALWSEFRSRPK